MRFNQYKVLCAATALMATISCSGGEEAVRTGTPAYYWKVALENFDKADYAKTNEWLEKITRASKNPFSEKAWTFRLTLMSGLLRGDMELADQWEYGARSNKTNPMRFRKYVGDYRGEASRRALELAEAFAAAEKVLPAIELPIEYPYPARGSITMPAAISRIQTGQMPQEEEIASVYTQMMQRGVVLQICDVMGAPKDTAKAQALMKTPPVKVTREAWELAMADVFHEASTIFNPKKQSDPTKQEFFLNLAQKSFAAAPSLAKEESAMALKKKLDADAAELKTRKK